MVRVRRTIVLLVACSVALAGCGDDDGTESASTGGVKTDYPLTVENCGEQVTLDAAPHRVVILGSSPIPLVEAAGALDRVIAKAGEFPDALYTDATRRAVAAIPTIGEGESASGTVQISQEVVVDQRSDLVIGYETETVKRAALTDSGIPMLILPGFCANKDLIPKHQDFDDVYAQVEFWGKVFGTQDAAAAAVTSLRSRVAKAQASFTPGEERSAATLFVSLGGGPLYAYGTSSMAHPQMAAAGLKNVFGDVDERVFEVTPEELVARDPEVLIILYVEGEPAAITDSLLQSPGVASLRAVSENQIYLHLFGFTDPPTPLSVDGLEKIVARFGKKS